MNFIHNTIAAVNHAFAPAIQNHSTALSLIGAVAAANVGLFILTRGKEFVIGTIASVLFLFPFLQA